MKLVPQTLTAVPVAALDARGIRRELAEIGREGMSVVLGADQIAVLGLEFARVANELYEFNREE